MNLDDILYNRFEEEIKRLVQTKGNPINKDEVKGNVREAQIIEFKNENVYIYEIDDLNGKKTEIIITSSEDYKALKEEYIKGYNLISSVVSGSYIRFVDEENQPNIINFYLKSVDNQVMQGKITKTKLRNQSNGCKKTINKFQDIQGSNGYDTVGTIINEIMKLYYAIVDCSIFFSNIRSGADFPPDIVDNICKFYSDNKGDILQGANALKTYRQGEYYK